MKSNLLKALLPPGIAAGVPYLLLLLLSTTAKPGDPVAGPLIWALLMFPAAGIYFLPSIVSGLRGSPSYAGILILNLAASWTGLGWLVALVWAAVDRTTPAQPVVIQQVFYQHPGGPPLPPLS